MLDLLVKYAHDHKLVTEPGFAPRTVRWCLSFDKSGNFLGVIELGDTGSKQNPGQTFDVCPDLQQPELIGGSEIRCHFLIETVQVLGLLFRDEAEEEKSGARAREKRSFFIRMLLAAGSATPQLTPVGNALDSEMLTARIKDELEMRKAKPGDKVTIAIDNAFPVESEAWHPWWREFRAGLRGKTSGENVMCCFVTGEQQEPISSHLTISGLASVGGNPTGDRLICFDKAAFTSFGLQQSANCAVCEDAAATYRAALNHLISKSDRPLVGAKVVHWFKSTVPEDSDVFSWLGQPSTEQIETTAKRRADDLLNSIRKGQRPDLANNTYYALTLSGAGGRIMVRDWMEGSFEELVESIGRWFGDLQIVNIYGSKPAKDAGIGRIVTSLLPPKVTKQDSVQPQARALWKSALHKEIPIPYSALAKAVMLHTRFILSGDFEDALDTSSKSRDHVNNISLIHTRMAIIKAYHMRMNGGDRNIMPYLNEEHPNPAYQCGRLMAILASLQRRALGDVGAGVVQRFYAAASATPAMVLGRLVRTSQFHLNKLDAGLAYWYNGQIAQVWGRIQDNVPKTLNLEEQSLFALGYYQQIAADRAKTSNGNTNSDETTEANDNE